MALHSRKVLFVIPPYFNAMDYLDESKAAVLPAFTIPYGILSMEAFLRANCKTEVEFELIDLNVTLKRLIEARDVDHFGAVFKKEIHQKLAEFPADIVGISALFNTSFGYMEHLACAIKEFDSGIFTVAGGGLPSAAYELMLTKCPSIDAICKGEGELPMCALIDSEDFGSVVKDHVAWVDREGIKAGKRPAHDFIQNLDRIPSMNYEFLNLENYNSRSIDKRYADMPKREMAIHTSRGCPFLCVFCSNPSLHGRDMRAMSIDRVIADVERMRDDFGMTVLMIEDDHFFFSKERAKALLERIAGLGIRCEFPNGVAVYAIDDEVAGLFNRAGVSAVALAVESGSDYVLNQIIKKPLKKRLIRPAVDALRRHDVRSHVFIVAGLPGEMDEHRAETVEMLIDSGFDWAHIYLAIPIYGSRLYDICVENGYIQDSASDEYVVTKSVIKAPGVDPEKLQDFAYKTQIRVNFAENHNMRFGRFEVALPYFRNVVSKYPDHAFGQLFAARCLAALGHVEEARSHLTVAQALFTKSQWWRDIATDMGVDYDAIGIPARQLETAE